jgi:hypothetical protein
MMETPEILRCLADAGMLAVAEPSRDTLRVRPAAAISEELAESIRAWKPCVVDAIVKNGIEWDGAYYAWHPTHFGLREAREV